MMTFMKILGGYKHLCPPAQLSRGTVPPKSPPLHRLNAFPRFKQQEMVVNLDYFVFNPESE